jgi:hypothetical protein
MDGMDARISALLDAVVRSSPEMKPSWYSVLPTTPSTISRPSMPGVSGPSPRPARARGSSRMLATANRTAVNASGGKRGNTPLVTLKLMPQMRTTTNMPRSAAEGRADTRPEGRRVEADTGEG